MAGQKKFFFFEDEYGIHMTHSWRSTMSYFMAFFTAFWCSFLVFWFSMATSGGAPIVFFVVPIIHVLVGIFLLYKTVTDFVNKTSIDIVGDELTVKHGPIPWFKGDRELNVKDVQQFFVKEIQQRTENGNVIYKYNVFALLHDGNRMDITSGIELDSEHALMIEQKLETHLGIVDRPIKGAYGNIDKSQPTKYEDTDEATLDLEDFKNRPEPEIEPEKRYDDEDFV